MTQILISWGPATFWAAVLFFLSSQSDLPGGFTFPLDDKVLHLGFFVVLGATLAWAGRNTRRRSAHVALILVGIVFAVTDEWHQFYVPHRDPSAGDFVADMVGVILGYLLIRRVLASLRRGVD